MSARDLNDVIDDIGIGPFQFMQLILVGGIILTDGAEMLLASSLLTALQDVWHLTAMQRAMMMTLIFMGVFIGGLIGGNIADVYGRRRAILLSYVGLVVAGGAIALAQGPVSMMILRFMFGICFGSGVAPVMTMCVETAPSDWRAYFTSWGSVGYAFGEVYISVLLVMFMPDLVDPMGKHWRWLTLLSVVPGCLFGCLSFLFLPESPHWLLAQGKRAEALAAVQYMAHINNKAEKIEGLQQLKMPAVGEATALIESSTGDSAMLASAAPSSLRSTRLSSLKAENQIGALAKVRESIALFSSRRYQGIMICGGYLCFLGNFLCHGMTYLMPQVFRHLHRSLTPAYQVLIASACDIPGVLIVSIFIYSKRIGHRDGLMLLAACSAVLCLTLVNIERGGDGLAVGLPSAYLLTFTSSAFLTLVYVYLSEIFPASVRSSGIAFCISAGRVGSMAAPLVVEMLLAKDLELLEHKVPHAPFLVLVSSLCVLAVVFIQMFLHFELKNAPLLGCTATAGSEVQTV